MFTPASAGTRATIPILTARAGAAGCARTCRRAGTASSVLVSRAGRARFARTLGIQAPAGQVSAAAAVHLAIGGALGRVFRGVLGRVLGRPLGGLVGRPLGASGGLGSYAGRTGATGKAPRAVLDVVAGSIAKKLLGASGLVARFAGPAALNLGFGKETAAGAKYTLGRVLVETADAAELRLFTQLAGGTFEVLDPFFVLAGDRANAGRKLVGASSGADGPGGTAFAT